MFLEVFLFSAFILYRLTGVLEWFWNRSACPPLFLCDQLSTLPFYMSLRGPLTCMCWSTMSSFMEPLVWCGSMEWEVACDLWPVDQGSQVFVQTDQIMDSLVMPVVNVAQADKMWQLLLCYQDSTVNLWQGKYIYMLLNVK